MSGIRRAQASLPLPEPTAVPAETRRVEPTPFPVKAALPDAGLTFTLRCRTQAATRTRPHPVTLFPDWRLDTGHDLDTERIGVALGGVCTCVETVDRTLPAAAGYLRHRLRLTPAEIARSADQVWNVAIPVAGCCDGQAFPSAPDAAAHLRRPAHWVRRFGASTRSVNTLAQQILDALARLCPVGTDQTKEPVCPASHAAASDMLLEPFGLDDLWAAGVHPADAAAAWRELSRDQSPVPARLVLNHLYSGRGDPWLAPFFDCGPMVVGWAVRTRSSRDLSHPDERIAWVRAGVPLPTIAAILRTPTYSLGDARALAARTGTDLAVAARRLGRWCEAGLSPTLDALVSLYSGPLLLDQPPSTAAIGRAVALAGARGVHVKEEDAACALMRAGTASAAAALLADSVRRAVDP